MAKLKTETDTPEMSHRIESAALGRFDIAPDDVFFEHGQWWIRYLAVAWIGGPMHEYFVATFGADADVVTFSVVDAVGGASVDGFDFEEV